jgi:hypothetical protein
MPAQFIFAGPALVITIPQNQHLKPALPYAFRILVENPAEIFNDVDNRDRWWRIETRKCPDTNC